MVSRSCRIIAFTAFFPFCALAGDGLIALVAIQPGASPDPATSHVIANMPLATSQQGLGLCYSHAAAAVFNYYQCQALKVDCTSVSSKKLASPFDLARFGREPDGSVQFSSSYGEIEEGGGALYALEVSALMVGNVASQACISEELIFKDKYVADGMTSESDVKAQRAVLESLKRYYRKYKLQPESCTDCEGVDAKKEAELKKIFATDKDAKAISWALTKPSFGGFFASLVVPTKCGRPSNRVYFEQTDDMVIGVLSDTPKERNYAATYGALKKAIDANNPVIVDEACLFRKAKERCAPDFSHSLVIYGYGTICDKKGKCKDALRILNSWGEKWQSTEGSEWFDAKRLLDSTEYKKQSVGWLERKPVPDH